MKRALIISGSPRKEGSVTNLVAEQIEQAFKESGAESMVWKLSDKPLPTAEPQFHEDPINSGSEVVAEFARQVAKADIVVLCTPTYHGSYSSHIKNAMDCLTGDALSGKRVILSCHGGMTAGIPLTHLQDVVRTMQGSVVNSLIIIDRRDIGTEAMAERIKSVISEETR